MESSLSHGTRDPIKRLAAIDALWQEILSGKRWIDTRVDAVIDHVPRVEALLAGVYCSVRSITSSISRLGQKK